MILKKRCKYCLQLVTVDSKTETKDLNIFKLSCKHYYTEDKLKELDYNVTSELMGYKPYPYQIETARFLDRANGNALIAHEPGLGKTICANIWLKVHKERRPVLFVCKAQLIRQIFTEIVRWLGPESVPMILDKGDFIEGFDFYILSIDSADKVEPKISHVPWKVIVIDECQTIKNHGAKRTNAFRRIVNNARTLGSTKKRVIVKTLGNEDHIEKIARDLMKYHGVSDRFELVFSELGHRGGKRIYGLTECRSEKKNEGVITGRIVLDRKHCLEDPEDEVIETILHEIAHAITPGADHKYIWQQTCINIGGNGQEFAACKGTEELSDEHVVYNDVKILALSGTPIMNHAGEYFPILNILHPELPGFNGLNVFYQYHVDTWADGNKVRTGGLVDPKRFQELTKDFIIRYERNEVMKDLPIINRQFKFFDLEKDVLKAYERLMAEFVEFYEEGSTKGPVGIDNILGYLQKMRHLTGLSKVKGCVNEIQEFLEGTDRKLCVFHHHRDVGQVIYRSCVEICQELGIPKPEILNDTMSQAERDQFSTNCGKYHWPSADPRSRLLIASQTMGGEGLNLQAASDMILLERQWNPAREEQTEFRISRIGSTAKQANVSYHIAYGTVDEFLTELTEKKRQFVVQTLSGKEIAWNEQEVIRELAEMIYRSGKKKWKLS